MIHEQRAELSYLAFMLCLFLAAALPPGHPHSRARGCGVGGAVSSLVGGRTDSVLDSRDYTRGTGAGNKPFTIKEEKALHEALTRSDCKTSIFARVRFHLYWQHAAGSRSHDAAESSAGGIFTT